MATEQQRKEKRINSVRHAEVSGRSGTPLFRCVIRDASQHGCRIYSSKLALLPDDVTIQPQGLSQPLNGRIVWRKKDQAGIAFDM